MLLRFISGHWLEESGQWLENADQSHLALAGGKTVLQNTGYPINLWIRYNLGLTCLRADGPEVLDVVLDPAELLEEEVDVDHVGQDEKPGHRRQQVPSSSHLEIKTDKFIISCGVAWHRGSVCISHPAAKGLILGIPENFFESKIDYLDVAEIDRRHCIA